MAEIKDRYDVVIVGAGHNGLIAAKYLLDAGKSVAVFEKNPMVGGMSSTYEFMPGYKCSTGAMYFGHMAPELRETMELYDHEYEYVQYDPWLWSPSKKEGEYFAEFYPDTERTAQFLEKMYDKAEGDAYRKWGNLWGGLADAFIPLQMNPPISLGNMLSMFDDPESALMVRQMMFSSLEDLLTDCGFDLNKGAAGYFGHMCNDAGFSGPKSPLSAFGCGMHYIVPAAYECPKGGMLTIMNVFKQVVEEHGGEIFLNTPVEKFIFEDGAVKGVIVGGQRIEAGNVLSTLDIKSTLFRMVGKENLDETTIKLVNAVKSDVCTAQICLALKALPEYTCLPDGEQGGWQHQACTVIGPNIPYAEDIYDQWKRGIIPERVSLVMVNESLYDPSMAPEGKYSVKCHVCSIPYELADGRSWDDQDVKDEFVRKVFDTIEEYAPNFRDIVEDYYVFTPNGLKEMFGTYDWGHADPRLDQMFSWRPMPGWSNYKTPIEGLYIGGAGCHGGPGVSGFAGRNSALMLIENTKDE